MSFLVKGVASGIGLAREAAAQRSSNKSAAMPDSSQQDWQVEEFDSDSDESDNEDWDLDDAQPDLPPSYDMATSKEGGAAIDEIVNTFAAHHPRPSGEASSKLPCPVIIPQKRPGNPDRGFINAYAPVLLDSGIDQATFLDFLASFNEAIKARPVFTVITVAAQAVGNVPSPIAIGVSIGLTFASETAKTIDSRVARNKFLDEMNETLFKPNGLYAMIMSFQPYAKPSAEAVDISRVINKASASKSSAKKFIHSAKNQSGTSRGELEIPEAAPLIFPALDELDFEQKKSKVKKAGNFIAEYYDRRAQATYSNKHEGSKLTVAPAPEFTSRYSDPNHPASSGSIVSLLTGGHFNPGELRQQRRARKDEKLSDRGARRLDQGRGPNRRQDRAMENVASGSAGISRKEWRERHPERSGPIRKVVKRAVHPDVLYFMIVNMPSDQELADAQAHLVAME